MLSGWPETTVRQGVGDLRCELFARRNRDHLLFLQEDAEAIEAYAREFARMKARAGLVFPIRQAVAPMGGLRELIGS